MEMSLLSLLSHRLKQAGHITNFDKYLLSRSNPIVLEMCLLMRWIHEPVYVLRMTITNYMKKKGLILILFPFLFVFEDYKCLEILPKKYIEMEASF
jgi:hypothetical protein